MSDWAYLNKCRWKDAPDPYQSTEADGFNGVFLLRLNGLPVKVLASDGMGWQHVSVSIATSSIPPSWSIMCQVKDLFWEDEDCVMQLHPPKSQYVNYHPGVLHLWKPNTPGVTIPQPHWILVGPKGEQAT